MNGILLTTLAVLAGVCLYAAVHHLWIGLHRPSQRVHWLFATLSFFVACYVLAKLGAYRAASAEELVALRRWEVSFAVATFCVLPWFAAGYAGVRARAPLLILSALAVAVFAVNLALPYGITFVELPVLQHLTLPWGEQVADLRVYRRSVWFTGAWAVLLLVFVFSGYACARLYRRGEWRRSLTLAAALGVFLAFVLFNQVVNYGLVNFIHTAEFGFIALVMLMSAALSRELRASGAALAASEARFRTLVEQSPFSIQVLAPDGRTLRVNRAWEELWGTRIEALTGYNLRKDRQLVEKGVMPYLERGFAGEAVEIPPIVYNPAAMPEVPGAPFRDRWVRAFVYPVHDESGRVREVILTHEDITESKQAQDAMEMLARTSSAIGVDEFFQSVVRNLARVYSARYAFIGILLESKQDVRTLAVWAGNGLAENFEYNLHGTPCNDIINLHKELIPRDASRIYSGDAMLVEMGVESYFGAPLISSAGEMLGLISVMDVKPMELTRWTAPILGIFASRIAAELQQLRAERRLHDSEARLAALLDIAPGAIISIDARQNIIVFNREAQHIFGYAAGEMLGQPLEALIPEHCRAAHRDAVTRFGQESGGMRRSMGRPQISGLRKNGEVFPAEAAISRLMLDGQPIYTVALQDITERKRSDDELRRHREHLEELVAERTTQLAEANRELESFSYSVSHDLRAPLRALHGFSDALAEDCSGVLSEQGRDYLRRIQAASKKMGQLIDDMLLLSHITRAELRPAAVDLCALARQVAEGLRQRDPERRVEMMMPDRCPVQGDARLLTIALENLIGNAWKFTRRRQQARIEIGQLVQRNETVYYVRDNGAGFNMAYADKLFGAFQRLHPEQQFEGTGVGLSIVQRIIHRHGGRVWAEAVEGQGATFYFTLAGSQHETTQ